MLRKWLAIGALSLCGMTQVVHADAGDTFVTLTSGGSTIGTETMTPCEIHLEDKLKTDLATLSTDVAHNTGNENIPLIADDKQAVTNDLKKLAWVSAHGCGCDKGMGPTPTVSAVPLLKASTQGAVGFGVLALGVTWAAARRVMRGQRKVSARVM
jgi:hypothetical protein